MIKKYTAVILIITIAIAIIYGGIIRPSWYVFFSCLLIGLWIIFTIKFFQKRKEYSEYNSPKNTSFFLLYPLGVGLFYNIWGHFTGFWGKNLLEDFVPFLYLNFWILLFAVPYLLYGIFKIRACFKKFDVVYIIRTRSLNARKFGIFYTILVLFALISYMLYYKIYFDVTVLFVCTILVLIFIINGIFGSKHALPEVSQEYIARRRHHLERITSTPIRTTPQRSTITTPSRSTASRPTPISTTRTTTSRPATTRTSRASASRPTSSRARRPKVQRPKAAVRPSYEKLRPKAGILSLEDFKCIFCFQLPKLPADEKRGIILCPNCRHPAHADEFKNWSKSSHLCSRCDAPIPPSFLRNPKIISVKEYLEVIKEFAKRKR